MKFDSFIDYMFFLLPAPFKQIKKALNSWYIYCKVIGKLFDDAKTALFKAREASIIASASEEMLTVIGVERNLIRLKNETVENYRLRLMLKGATAAKAGTKEGIILTATTLGYDTSQIVPCYTYDSEKWAEFDLYLSGNYISSINELNTIKEEIDKVKTASSKCNLIFFATPNSLNLRVGIASISSTIITNRQVI